MMAQVRSRKSTILLVHGAWHGSWCWQRVVPLIEQQGFEARTVDLPSVGADPGAQVDLSNDANAVRAALDDIAGSVVLCGHSYGGMVISQAALDHPRVARLVYLCAFIPDDGQSLIDVGGGEPAPWMRVDDRGMTLPDMNEAKAVFYTDCDDETQEWARRQLKSQPLAAFTQPVAQPAWRKIPSTYVICSTDQAMPVALQRTVLSQRATDIMELEADHSPFLSQPDAVAELLTGLARLS